MKKILSFILAALMMFSFMTTGVQAEDAEIRIVIDGKYKIFDVMPVIEDSRTLVPLRGIFETLGATVSWEEETETVTAVKDDIEIKLQIGSNKAYVKGEEKELDVPAKTINGRTMVPVRFISESLGMRVEWDELKNRVFVNSLQLHQKGIEALDGKKVIFIGDANLYHNRVLINVKTPELETRVNQKTGIFYELCKANGIDANITNWCFASHKLSDLFGGNPCSVSGDCKGKNHEEYLSDACYDYVVVSPSKKTLSGGTLEEDFDNIISFFKKANENVKFILLGNALPYGFNKNEESFDIKAYENIEKKGVSVVDWGEVADDSVKYVVEGIKEYFDNYSYVIKDKENTNLLSGYTASIMAYCAITGEKAAIQPDEFMYDTYLAPDIDIPGYIDYYYFNGHKDTNNDEIFNSKSNLEAFKVFADKHLDKTYERPENVIEKPENPDEKSENEDVRIKVVCVGDSITFGSGITGTRAVNSYPAQLNKILGEDKYNVLNFGKPSYCATKASPKSYWDTQEHKASLEAKGDVLVIMFGTNDIRTDYWDGSDSTKGVAVKETYVDDYCALIEGYREVNPDVKIVIMTPPPTFNNKLRPNERIVNELIPEIKKVAEKTNAEVVELYPLFENKQQLFADSLHPTNDGAGIIASAVAEAILN